MKKLYKIEQGKKLCGVCGGIIWALVALFWGTGILLYIVAAFILPGKSEVYYETVKDDKTSTDGPIDGEVINNDK